ncbi:MAG TPA: hypothetical protein DCZ94_21110 [Lentisphaeria bacterium]|nr:MAG: hypothetical protein A2X48_16655 [Lentisphaerae bacterium GWF2_49_21]HBC89445.1 hypothetical protein [Lentisphaeria bacterium]
MEFIFKDISTAFGYFVLTLATLFGMAECILKNTFIITTHNYITHVLLNQIITWLLTGVSIRKLVIFENRK